MQAPFSRLVRVDGLRKDGETVAIEATEAERAALAELLKLPAIEALKATFAIKPSLDGGARVTGAVHGRVTQTCVVTLEPFPATVEEEVDVRFAPIDPGAAARRPPPEPETASMTDADEPDPIVDGRIDLGALAAEFLALGLDPYPRKPGATFAQPSEPEAETSPFAALRDGRKP